jgi:hypothetical protein
MLGRQTPEFINLYAHRPKSNQGEFPKRENTREGLTPGGYVDLDACNVRRLNAGVAGTGEGYQAHDQSLYRTTWQCARRCIGGL